MTLCMAAPCPGGTLFESEFVIVGISDARIETASSGGDIGYKRAYVTKDGHWQALLAGEVSAAEDFTSTLQSVLHSNDLTRLNLHDKFNEGSAAFKEKLIKRLVQLRLGMSFERFLKHGKDEVAEDVRSRLWYEIERIPYECELLIFGFLGGGPLLFRTSNDGDVSECRSFAAIGTGAVVAEAVLFQREQDIGTEFNRTVYNLYEAYRLACKAGAPGVAGGPHIWLMEPVGEGLSLTGKAPTGGLRSLAKTFDKYGPRKVKQPPEIKADSFKELDF